MYYVYIFVAYQGTRRVLEFSKTTSLLCWDLDWREAIRKEKLPVHHPTIGHSLSRLVENRREIQNGILRLRDGSRLMLMALSSRTRGRQALASLLEIVVVRLFSQLGVCFSGAKMPWSQKLGHAWRGFAWHPSGCKAQSSLNPTVQELFKLCVVERSGRLLASSCQKLKIMRRC